MSVFLIYARSENYCIGLDGDLPWSLPDEYAHFIRTTEGGVVIMGRKTYQDHNSYLSGRINIVVTHNKELSLAPNVLRASSLFDAIALAKKDGDRIFVIGGSALLREAMPLATTVYETVVHTDLVGDTFIDPFDFSSWRTDLLETHLADTAHDYGYTVYRHVRDLPSCRD